MQFMDIEITTIFACLDGHKTKANRPLRKRLKKIHQEIKETKHEPKVWLTKWEAKQSIKALKQSGIYDKLNQRGKTGWQLMYKSLRAVGDSMANDLVFFVSQINHDISMAKHSFTKEVSEDIFKNECLAQITQAYFGYALKTLESFDQNKLIKFLKDLKRTLIKLNK